MEACKEAGLKARGSKIQCKSQKKWFDEECEKGKKNCKKNSHNINNSELRQLLQEKKKSFKQICGRKKAGIYQQTHVYYRHEGKKTCQQIRKIFNLRKRKTHGARGTHITRDMRFPHPGGGTHVTRDMCFPCWNRISLGIRVS